MKLTWLGHSCFKLETQEGSIIFDPFQDGSVPGFGNIREIADRCVCSHEHFDHNAKELVELTGTTPTYSLEVVDSFHDDVQGEKRGKNRIHVLHAEGKTIVHLGDLGHRMNEEQLTKVRNCDVLLIPVGGFFTIDAQMAQEVAASIHPQHIVPMHYRSDTFGFDQIATVEEFLSAYPHVQHVQGTSILVEEMEEEVVVFHP